MKKNKRAKLSAIVPVTRMAGNLKYLELWLEEISNLRIEALVIHDIGDDKTGPELRSIIEKQKLANVTLIEGIFGSPGMARNAGLAVCSGDWICFWDSDDLPRPSSILSELELCDDSKTDILIGNYLEQNSEGFILHKHNGDLTKVFLNPGLWRMVFHRSILNSVEFTELKMAEDQLFLSRILTKNPLMAFSEKIFYEYFTGNDFQATKNPVALNDLPKAIYATRDMLHEMPLAWKKFLRVMLMRQTLTLLKQDKAKNYLDTESKKLGRLSKAQALRPLLNPMIWIYLTSLRRQRSSKVKSLVILNGGLGNLLFQKAFALRVNEYFPCEVSSFLSNSINLGSEKDFVLANIEPKSTHGNFVARSLAIRVYSLGLRLSLKLKKLGRPNTNIGIRWILQLILYINYKSRFSVYLPSDLGDGLEFTTFANRRSVYIGYFQSSSKLPDAILKSMSSLCESLSVKETESDRCNSDKCTAIHMRFGDYIKEKSFGLMTPNYFKSALDLLQVQNKIDHICVFSDDLSRALSYVPVEYRGFVRTGNPHLGSLATFQRMRLSQSLVISNSTFSCWAALSSLNKSQSVVGPKPWFKLIDAADGITLEKWSTLNPWIN